MIKKYNDFVEHLNESSVYLKPDQIPVGIKNWVKDTFGAVKGYEVDQSGDKVHIGMPWHERCINVYQFFNLVGDDAVPVGDSVQRKGWESDNYQDYIEGQTKEGYIEVPDGKILVRYSSYPKGIRIYTGKGAKLFLPDTTQGNDLTDEELVILTAAKSLKSAYRPKFSDESYKRLIDRGLLAKNRSITIDGRNLLPTMKDKIKTAIDNYNKNKKYPQPYMSPSLYW